MMELDALRVRNYRCIEDSGWISIDRLTCLIGKNESGKTTFMEAVEQLNPSVERDGFDPYKDYPRQRWAAYSDRHEKDPDIVVSGRFGLEETEIDEIEDEFRRDLLGGREVVVHRDYKNEYRWDLSLDESAVIEYLLDSYEFEDETARELRDVDTIDGLTDVDTDADIEGAVREKVGDDPVAAVSAEIGTTALIEKLPEFRLVGEYSIMDGELDIDAVLDRHETNDLEPGDQTFLSLLSVAGLELEAFADIDNWEEKTTKLETASARISSEAMDYWSQSGDLQIRIQATADPEEEGQTLGVRVENQTHNVTVEFERRSRGFRWFFSSFCQLSELREREEDIVLLLDEPGLNLHARAKQQFLEFMKDEIATDHPIIYTTHSPFMIDPENLHRTKMVMADPVGETNLFTDIALADEHTQFPLRNVFELDLMDTVLVNPQALLVEQKADHIYLNVLSKILTDHDQSGLDSRWTVVPIKHNENIASFIALFGGDRLDVAALLNDDPADRRRQGRSDRERSIEAEIPTKVVSTYADKDDGTIEDVLSASFYLTIVNRTYATAIKETGGVPEQITVSDLGGREKDPIIERLAAYFAEHNINDGTFERSEPALYLQQNREELAENIDKASRRNFDRLFRDLNNTLESFESVDSQSGSILETLGLS